MRFGHPSYQPSNGQSGIPELFHDCQRLWGANKDRDAWADDDFWFVGIVIEPELVAILQPDSEHIAGGLVSDGSPIMASMIEVDSVIFADGPIPIVNAWARFTVQFDRRFSNYDSWIEWQEEHGWLDGSVEFHYRFKLDGIDETIRADRGSTGIECELFYDGVSLLTAG